jgi:hypothetical protein
MLAQPGGGFVVAGIDTVRGIAFQLAQTLGDVVDLVVDSDGDAVVVEGADDVVDYEVLDRNGRRLAVRQAKTRREPGTWGATELAKCVFEKLIFCWCGYVMLWARWARVAGCLGSRVIPRT